VSAFDDLEYASLTDVGVRRSHNQDNHAVLLATDEQQWQARGHIFLVADGMGAHAVGELASEQAVGVIPHLYDKYAPQGTMTALRKAFVEANASIHSRGQQNKEFEGMGTTATALVLRPDGAWIGHVGDSRCYRVRDGKIEQLSFDHSMVWEYARRQKIDPDKVQGIPSNVIFRSLGPEPLVAVDIEGVHPIHADDVFVLCSDGLSGLVSDAEIGAVVSVLSPNEACRLLIDLANLRGGPDNITVIVVRAGQGLTTVPEPMVPLMRRLPWALGALLLGALLAGAATTFTVYLSMTLGVLTFLLAAASVAAGVVGLLSYHAREKREAATAERPRPKIHRSHSCQIERPLLDKLAHAAQALKAQTEEKGWDVDWRAFEVNYNSAEVSVSRGALVEACREYCRALQTLLDAMREQRARGEVFHPNWDRKEPGSNGK
jgi:protein phosphatase